MIKNSLTEAPFSSRGELLHFAERRYGTTYMGQVIDWRPNDPMELTLTLGTVVSGRSAKYLLWATPDGTTHPMFVIDLVEMMRQTTVVHGVVHGMFRVRKRGTNFGLCYVGPVKP